MKKIHSIKFIKNACSKSKYINFPKMYFNTALSMKNIDFTKLSETITLKNQINDMVPVISHEDIGCDSFLVHRFNHIEFNISQPTKYCAQNNLITIVALDRQQDRVASKGEDISLYYGLDKSIPLQRNDFFMLSMIMLTVCCFLILIS